jgi:hypothetical protein
MSKSPVRKKNFGLMQAISLPAIAAGSTLRQAAAEMKRAQRSGVVVTAGREARVVSASEIARADKRGVSLKDVEGLPVHVFDVTPIAQSTPEPYLSSDALARALKSSKRKYGLLAAPTGNSKNAIVFSLGDLHVLFKEPGPSRPKKTTREAESE